MSSTADRTIGIGGGAGTLHIDDAELALLTDGFSSITIGDTASGTRIDDQVRLEIALKECTRGNWLVQRSSKRRG